LFEEIQRDRKEEKRIIFFAIPNERGKKMRVECPYRIVLADDHAMFRHGLKSVLVKKGDLDVVGRQATVSNYSRC
jgi:hypothetical protein